MVASNEVYGAPELNEVSFAGITASAAGSSGRLYAIDGSTGKFLPGWPVKMPGLIQEVLPLIGPGQDANGASLPAITAGSPAEKAGLKDGDIIVAIQDQAIDQEHPLDMVLSGFAPGQTIDVHILRNGQPQVIKVTLGTRPATL